MLRRIGLDEQEAKRAIAEGDFGQDIVHSAEHVALILTQGWCSDWNSMNHWLDDLIEQGEPIDLDIDVYHLIYDRVPCFREFLDFKEVRLGNYHVPYVRYYSRGVLVGESNYVNPARFLERFRDSDHRRGSEDLAD